ncbi:MAG: prolyl oligopeptidase family serine peptidase, partial [Candidatus Latescibacteria bacterium]|nr:prolyl oligopeptidase family serine peptidase [Candidatus Latescibacterota bacterium]
LADYRYSGWGFAMRWMPAEEKLFVNEKDVLLPHLRVGEKPAGWAHISLVNTTDEALKDVEITVEESDLFLPTTTKAYVLKAQWDSRAAFRIETKRAVTKRDSSARIALVIRSGDEVHRVTRTPKVRDREPYFTKTYLSEVDGSVQPYSLLMPPDYDGKKPAALMIALHGAHVKECIGSYKPKEGMIIASAYGRGNTGYREIGTNDVMTVLRLVREQYNIDENRIYLAGHSMGGHGTWYLGTHYPDLWAALNPMSGYGDYRIWNNKVPDWQVPLYEDRSAIFFIENALHLPIFDVHGVKDNDVTVKQSQRIMAELEKLGYEAVYDEHPDRPHWWGMDFPNAIAFLK